MNLLPCSRCGEQIEIGTDGLGRSWWYCSTEDCENHDPNEDLNAVIRDANKRAINDPGFKENLIKWLATKSTWNDLIEAAKIVNSVFDIRRIEILNQEKDNAILPKETIV